MIKTTALNTLALRDSDIQAVRTIGARDIWGIDELPESLDPTTLLELDRRGLVEVRMVVVKNTQEHPDDPPTHLLQRHAWFSPYMEPWKAGEWGGHSLTDRQRDHWKHPIEVRLTRRGRDIYYDNLDSDNSSSESKQAERFLPTRDFPKDFADRLQRAASAPRKLKRVRRKKVGGIWHYSYEDALKHWPVELQELDKKMRKGRS